MPELQASNRVKRLGRVVRFRRIATMMALTRLAGRLIGQGAVVPAILLCGGCARPDLDTVPVSGVVTLDGKPVPHVLVVFNPTHGTPEHPNRRPGADGMTDENGRFQLRTLDRRGAVAGEHVVSLIDKDPAADPDLVEPDSPPRSRLPPEACDRSLRFLVPAGGTDEACFALRSSGRPPSKNLSDGEILAARAGGGPAELAESAHPSPEIKTPAGRPERFAASRAAPYASTRDPAPWYLTAISVWFVVLVGCFCWWRFNVRQLRVGA